MTRKLNTLVKTLPFNDGKTSAKLLTITGIWNEMFQKVSEVIMTAKKNGEYVEIIDRASAMFARRTIGSIILKVGGQNIDTPSDVHVAAYEAATQYDRSSYPMAWANMHQNLGDGAFLSAFPRTSMLQDRIGAFEMAFNKAFVGSDIDSVLTTSPKYGVRDYFVQHGGQFAKLSMPEGCKDVPTVCAPVGQTHTLIGSSQFKKGEKPMIYGLWNETAKGFATRDISTKNLNWQGIEIPAKFDNVIGVKEISAASFDKNGKATVTLALQTKDGYETPLIVLDLMSDAQGKLSTSFVKSVNDGPCIVRKDAAQNLYLAVEHGVDGTSLTSGKLDNIIELTKIHARAQANA